MRFSVDDKSLKELENMFKDLDKDISKELIKEMDLLGSQWVKEVRRNTARQTGLLRKSWKKEKAVKVNGVVRVEVYNNTEYAKHYEYGHRIMRGGQTYGVVKGRYPLTKTRQNIRKKLPKAIRNAIKRALK